MSNSPVVAIIVTSLAAVLASFFGLSASSDQGARVLRIAFFGLACPVAVFLGVGVRSHSWLAPSIQEQVTAWTKAGYTAEQARSFVVFRQLGLIPGGQKTSEVPKSYLGLFSASSQSDDPIAAECGHFSASRFSNSDERLRAMQNAGGAWKSLADSVLAANAPPREGIVESAYQLVCH